MSFMINIDDTKDTALAMEAANHDFTVEKHRIKSVENNIVIPDHVAVMNQNTGQYLGTVGIGWEPVQPEVLYDLAGELISSTNGVINGAFSMHNGSIIGIRFKLADRQYVENDVIDLNFLMITAFNGTHGIAGHATIHRLVSDVQCSTSSKVYNLKHTKNVMNRIAVVKDMLKYYHNEIASFDKRMTTMVKSRMNDNAAIEWFESLFPKPNSERAQNILNNQVGTFIDILHNSVGSSYTGVRGTCYNAFQALVEYINHYRSIRIHNEREEDEVRFQTVHFGSGNTLLQKGLKNISASFSEFSVDEFMIE